MLNSHLKRHQDFDAQPFHMMSRLTFLLLFGIGKSHFNDLFLRCFVERVGPPFLDSLHINCNVHQGIDVLFSCHIFLAAHREGAQCTKAESTLG